MDVLITVTVIFVLVGFVAYRRRDMTLLGVWSGMAIFMLLLLLGCLFDAGLRGFVNLCLQELVR
jgi:hypothetical protein